MTVAFKRLLADACVECREEGQTDDPVDEQCWSCQKAIHWYCLQHHIAGCMRRMGRE